MITELNNIKFATRLLTAITHSASVKLKQPDKSQLSKSTINSLGPTFAIIQLLKEIINSQRQKIAGSHLSAATQSTLADAEQAIAAATTQQEKYAPLKGSNISLPKDNPHLKNIKKALASKNKMDMRNELSQFIFSQMNYLQSTALTNLLLIDTIITANPDEIPQNLLAQYQKFEAQYRNNFSNQLIHTMVELFLKIKSEDLLNNNGNAKNFSDCYNKLTTRMTWHVIRINDIHTRTLFMDRLIKMALQLKNQGFYAPYASIMAGLHNVSVTILKKTITGLSEESKAAYAAYLTETSSVEKQKNYCKQMEERSKKVAVLPDLPSYLNMLGAINEGGKVGALTAEEDKLIVHEALTQYRKQLLQQQDPAASSSDEALINTEDFKKIRVRLNQLYLQKKIVNIISGYQQKLSSVQVPLSDTKLNGSLLTPREMTRDMFSAEEMTAIVNESVNYKQSLAVTLQYYVDEKVYVIAKSTDEKKNAELHPSDIVQKISHAGANHKAGSYLKENTGNQIASVHTLTIKNNSHRVSSGKNGSQIKGKKRSSNIDELSTCNHKHELPVQQSKSVEPVVTDYILEATRTTLAKYIHNIEKEINPHIAAHLAKKCLAKNALGALTAHQDNRKALIEDPDKTQLDKLVEMASAPTLKGKKIRDVFISTNFFNTRLWQGKGLSIYHKSTLRKQRIQYARKLGIPLANPVANDVENTIVLQTVTPSSYLQGDSASLTHVVEKPNVLPPIPIAPEKSITLTANADNNHSSVIITRKSSTWVENAYSGIKQFFSYAVGSITRWFSSDITAVQKEMDGNSYALIPISHPNSPREADLLNNNDAKVLHDTIAQSTSASLNNSSNDQQYTVKKNTAETDFQLLRQKARSESIKGKLEWERVVPQLRPSIQS